MNMDALFDFAEGALPQGSLDPIVSNLLFLLLKLVIFFSFHKYFRYLRLLIIAHSKKLLYFFMSCTFHTGFDYNLWNAN